MMYVIMGQQFFFLAAKKLNLDKDKVPNLKIFLPDGFEIDEDEILLSDMTHDKILHITEDFNETSSKGNGN